MEQAVSIQYFLPLPQQAGAAVQVEILTMPKPAAPVVVLHFLLLIMAARLLQAVRVTRAVILQVQVQQVVAVLVLLDKITKVQPKAAMAVMDYHPQ
jgi:hypothetical protein